MLAFLAWWLIIQLFSLAALPLTRRVFAWLPDRGYAFAKTTGLLLVSYLLWLGAVSGILINEPGGIVFALLLVALISGWILLSPGWAAARQNLQAFWRENRAHILTVETLFVLAFAGWTLVRAFSPDKILPAGGEKYMEIAFLNGVLNSPRFPPLDPWLSGYAISYYYFGYVMMAVMTSLSGAAPAVGFDLYDALLFALSAVTAYGVVSNLIRAAGGSQRAASGGGLLGGLFVVGLGNLQGLLEGLYASRLLPAAFWEWLDIPDLMDAAQSGSFYPGHGWWWWRASRVLRDLNLTYQPVPVQPIDEFPFFSFLLGDNHPHKLALPFVLLAVGLAFNLLLKASAPAAPAPDQPEELSGWRRWAGWLWVRRAEAGLYLFYALVLGSLGFLNTWDFPIYLGLVLLADAAGRYFAGEPFGLRLLLREILLGAALGTASILLYLFFYIGFSSQAGGVLPYVFPPTRLAQYLVMFGPFVLMLGFFLALTVRRTASARFPLGDVLNTWLRITAVLYAVYLFALLAGALVLATTGLENNPLVQSWLSGLELPQGLGRILLVRLANPWLYLVLSTLLALALTGMLRLRSGSAEIESAPRSAQCGSPSSLFVLLLAFFGLGLTLTVEFFYLRDNFGARMNTIFKFYFQAWVLMACASAYAIWWISRHAGAVTRVIFQVSAALLVAAGLIYPLMGVYSRTEGFSHDPALSAAATFAGEYPGRWAEQPDDWAAVQWLREQGRPDSGDIPIILEGGSGGYENAGRISAFTGYPTLLGWTNHEGQWRGNYEQINRRSPVIAEIYTTASPQAALDLLREWNVRYVIVGSAERQYIDKLCQDPARPCNTRRALEKFDSILIPVFSQGTTSIYQVP